MRSSLERTLEDGQAETAGKSQQCTCRDRRDDEQREPMSLPAGDEHADSIRVVALHEDGDEGAGGGAERVR